MIDSERKGEISLDDFQLILNSTQRVVNSVDKFSAPLCNSLLAWLTTVLET